MISTYTHMIYYDDISYVIFWVYIYVNEIQQPWLENLTLVGPHTWSLMWWPIFHWTSMRQPAARTCMLLILPDLGKNSVVARHRRRCWLSLYSDWATLISVMSMSLCLSGTSWDVSWDFPGCLTANRTVFQAVKFSTMPSGQAAVFRWLVTSFVFLFRVPRVEYVFPNALGMCI